MMMMMMMMIIIYILDNPFSVISTGIKGGPVICYKSQCNTLKNLS